MAGKFWKKKQKTADETAGRASRTGKQPEEEAAGERPAGGGALEDGPSDGSIQVRICGREKGLEIYEGVSFIRVRSRKYNLLIMKDYLPILGKVEGSITFRNSREELEREGVSGFFMHKNNVFSLMLGDVRPEEAGQDDKTADGAGQADAKEKKETGAAPEGQDADGVKE